MLGIYSTIQTIPDWRQESEQVGYLSTQRGQLPSRSSDIQLGLLDKPKQEDDTKLLSQKILVQQIDSEIETTVTEIEESERGNTYQNFNVRTFINKVNLEINKWSAYGTQDSLAYIANIKEIINSYRKVLRHQSKSRILLNTVSLLLENNNWESVTSPQLNKLSTELNRFVNGDIKVQDLQIFSREFFRSKFSTLKAVSNEKE